MGDIFQEFDAEQLDTELECPHCGAPQSMLACVLGQWGSRIHHRCRHCGGEWSEQTIGGEE